MLDRQQKVVGTSLYPQYREVCFMYDNKLDKIDISIEALITILVLKPQDEIVYNWESSTELDIPNKHK